MRCAATEAGEPWQHNRSPSLHPLGKRSAKGGENRTNLPLNSDVTLTPFLVIVRWVPEICGWRGDSEGWDTSQHPLHLHPNKWCHHLGYFDELVSLRV